MTQIAGSTDPYFDQLIHIPPETSYSGMTSTFDLFKLGTNQEIKFCPSGLPCTPSNIFDL
ncbi:MAG: hypothetical protein SFU25_11565, partial [Candidatus Caenarcaniphilales bacterium]|nr:hypothetical protein [Candidatus Caenarcaniphilales bacterium]